MNPIIPFVKIDGDKKELMARDGRVVGFSNTQIVWRFGYLPESETAKSSGLSVPQFRWVRASHVGEIYEEFDGFAIELPESFKAVLDYDFRRKK
jgi:hypothetical protein